MSAIDELVEQQLRRQRRPAAWLVAASGGADSTALACILAGLRDRGRLAAAPIVLVHCDHRQHERSADAAGFVAGLARRLDLGFAVERLELPPGASEARMREARYRALGAAATATRGVVLTAHHRDDQIETVVLRALRGTGRRGLAGMPAVRALPPRGRLLRPLLDVPAAELRARLRADGI